jgi:hypothetical protein
MSSVLKTFMKFIVKLVVAGLYFYSILFSQTTHTGITDNMCCTSRCDMWAHSVFELEKRGHLMSAIPANVATSGQSLSRSTIRMQYSLHIISFVSRTR